MATSTKKAKVGDKVGGKKVLSTRRGVVTRVEGQKKDNSDRGSRSSNPKVNAINDARRANIAAGLDPYSGAGATAASAAKGKGGYDPNKAYSDLPSFSKESPAGVQAPVSPVAPQAPAPNALGPQAPVNAPTGLTTAPVATPAAAPTPTQNRYQAGLAAANASGIPAPPDAGAARSGVSSYLPAKQQDSSVVNDIFSNDPVIGQLMGSITQLLNPKNQTTSLMQDYKALRKQSGLDKINEELIDAETVIDGTEDDLRNEIQVAGGLGTESQVQAMALARNKGLLKRYNQLVQMKTDATNQLNTMMQLSAQDKQMAQERMNTAITTMFNMATFRQTALQNTRQQQQFMIQTMGADGYYATVAKDPRQLAMAEQIMGLAPGGLQAVAAQATAEKQRKAALEERQIRVAESGAAAQWANVAVARENAAISRARLNMEAGQLVGKAAQAEEAAVAKGAIVLNKVAEANRLIRPTTSGFFGNLFKKVGGSDQYALDQTLDTIKANLAFEELRKMRENSPTGGALGNVTERELQLLSNTASALDVGLDSQTLKNNLMQVQNQYTDVLAKMGYAVLPDGSIRPVQ